jgi:hypothetical protein
MDHVLKLPGAQELHVISSTLTFSDSSTCLALPGTDGFLFKLGLWHSQKPTCDEYPN